MADLQPYEQQLLELCQADERFVVMTAENRAAIRNLPPLLGNRFIDTGITEQAMIGAAAGLARQGRTPIVHALATFLTLRAFEFVRTDVGIAGAPVKLVGFVPGFLSDANGPTHQAIEDVSLMRGIPGVNVWAPAGYEDLLLGLKTILQDDHPWYIRYIHHNSEFAHSPNFQPGKAEVVNEGSDITLLTYGLLFKHCLEAQKRLSDQGYSVGLLNLRCLKPLDEEAVLRACANSRLVVTVEDHLLTGGLYSILAELLLHNRQTAEVLPLALDTWYKPTLLQQVLEVEGFTGERIAQRVEQHLQQQSIEA